MATMEDVARRAGVALSTVSHALSGKRPVSEETRQRILRAMDELDYQPHVLARGLATKRSGIVSLLVPPTFNALYESQFLFVASAAETARQMGYSLLLWTAPPDDAEIFRMVQQGFVEGLILMEVMLHDSRVEMLKERGYPFSLIGRCENNDGINSVDLDFEYVMDVSVAHLAELGHRHIALASFSQSLLDAAYGPAVRTVQGFNQAIKDRKLKGTIRSCSPTPQDGYAVIRALINKHPSISAVIAATDTSLDGVTQAVRDCGRRIPEDCSVIAITAPRYAQRATLALTAVDFPMAEMGQIGTEMLIDQLTNPAHQPRQVVLRPDLVRRQSTGPYNPIQ